MNVHAAMVRSPWVQGAAHGAARRLLDMVIAGAGLIVLSPIMLMVTLALWVESGRPILFRQVRLGAGGRRFQMYKFRKFRTDCGSNGAPLTIDGDSRMTAVGRILAATKLDELPQLWNVLKGEMAIVGPRPESLAFEDCFRGGFEDILRFKPGLLGPSQVFFRNEGQIYPVGEDPALFYRRVLFPAKARLDLDYFPRRTITSDIAWIARGVLAILGWVPDTGRVRT